MNSLYLTKDLLFSSRVTHTATSCGLAMSVVGSGSELLAALNADDMEAGNIRLVLIDFTTPGVDLLELVPQIRMVVSSPVAVVAFGPHVDVAGLAAAKQAGCDQVFSRGQFNSQMIDVLRRFGCTT